MELQLLAIESREDASVDLFGILLIFIITTDAGPDMVGCKVNIEKMMDNDLWKVLFEIDCLMHQYHIICKALFVLYLLEGFRKLVKLVSVAGAES